MRGCVRILFLTAVLSAQTIQEVEITGELHHQLVLANDQVRVFNVEVAAHGETLMHWHRHDYVYVMLGDAKGVDSIKGKDPVNVSLSDGDIGFVAGR